MTYITHDIEKWEKQKRREKYWAMIVDKCSLQQHPENLDEEDRQLQYFALSEVSCDPDNPPTDMFDWEEWYKWHLDNETKLI